jgi:hypothetical protein
MIDSLREFLKGSKTFAGITFQGMYGMDTETFLGMLKHFVETGENHLDEYSEMTWLSWGYYCHHEEPEHYTEKEREKIKKWLEGGSYWDFETFVSDDRLLEIKNCLVTSEAFDINRNSYKSRRRMATRFTSKKEIRRAVFEKHGEQCAKCGATEKIELDHIVPVVKGGENNIKNMQPLCKSCNSSKGCK